MNAIVWYMVFIGFLGSDAQPSYSLILDDVPLPTQAACAKRAESTNTRYVQSQKREYPDLEGYWICAAENDTLSRIESNTGWHIIWTGYMNDNTWATIALIGPKRFMTEQICYREAATSVAPNIENLTWESLCAEPITGQLN